MILTTRKTPLGHVVRLDKHAYYGHILARKPAAICPTVDEIGASLEAPVTVRASKMAADAFWYVRRSERKDAKGRVCHTLTCVRLNQPPHGFVATAVHTTQDGTSKGDQVWP